jgi:hypothetical protein
VCRKLDTTASALSVVSRHGFPVTEVNPAESLPTCCPSAGTGRSARFSTRRGPGCTTASGPAVPTPRPLATTGSQPVAAQALRSWAAPPTRCGLAGDPAPWPDTAEPAPRRSGRGAPARPRVIRGARRCGGSGAGNFVS